MDVLELSKAFETIKSFWLDLLGQKGVVNKDTCRNVARSEDEGEPNKETGDRTNSKLLEPILDGNMTNQFNYLSDTLLRNKSPSIDNETEDEESGSYSNPIRVFASQDQQPEKW